MYLTLARLTTLPRRREAPNSGTGNNPLEPINTTYPRQFSRWCRKDEYEVHQSVREIDLPKRQSHPQTSSRQTVDGPVASWQAPNAMQRQEGADDRKNPTVTTGISLLYGSEWTRDHHHRHSTLYGSGKRCYHHKHSGREGIDDDECQVNDSPRHHSRHEGTQVGERPHGPRPHLKTKTT